jgi:hypothetical protein
MRPEATNVCFYYDAESQAPAAAPRHEEEEEEEEEEELYQEDGLLYLVSAHIHRSIEDVCTGRRRTTRSTKKPVCFHSIHTYQGAIKALEGLY